MLGSRVGGRKIPGRVCGRRDNDIARYRTRYHHPVASRRGWSTRFGYGCLVLGFGFGEEFDEVVLPDGGLGVGAVAVGLVGDGDEDELRVRHFPGELFGDAELGRIDVVVGGVDVHDRDGDAAEVGLGVVVPRGVHVIDHVVRVDVRGGAVEV